VSKQGKDATMALVIKTTPVRRGEDEAEEAEDPAVDRGGPFKKSL